MAVNRSAVSYPVMNKAKLCSELSLIWEGEEFSVCSGAVATQITAPITTSEAGRYFSRNAVKWKETFTGLTARSQRDLHSENGNGPCAALSEPYSECEK